MLRNSAIGVTSAISLTLATTLTTPAFAATKYYAVIDTVGNCSVLEAAPVPDLKILGEQRGYNSKDAAKKAIKDHEGCKGIVE